MLRSTYYWSNSFELNQLFLPVLKDAIWFGSPSAQIITPHSDCAAQVIKIKTVFQCNMISWFFFLALICFGPVLSNTLFFFYCYVSSVWLVLSYLLFEFLLYLIFFSKKKKKKKNWNQILSSVIKFSVWMVH